MLNTIYNIQNKDTSVLSFGCMLFVHQRYYDVGMLGAPLMYTDVLLLRVSHYQCSPCLHTIVFFFSFLMCAMLMEVPSTTASIITDVWCVKGEGRLR